VCSVRGIQNGLKSKKQNCICPFGNLNKQSGGARDNKLQIGVPLIGL
jgi:ribosome modulation factor